MAVGQQRPTEPSIIRQAVEQWPEGQEVIPFMPEFISPPFRVTGGVVGIGGTDTDTEEYKQVPGALDLTAVRTDAFSVPLFFDQVCWTTTEPTALEKPDPLLPVPWEQHYWHAQVRNTGVIPRDPCWYYYNWIPAFGVLPTWDDYFKASLILEFTCTAAWMNQGGVYGTAVVLDATSAEMTVAPGSYRWDVQSSAQKVFSEDVFTDPAADAWESVNAQSALAGKAYFSNPIPGTSYPSLELSSTNAFGESASAMLSAAGAGPMLVQSNTHEWAGVSTGAIPISAEKTLVLIAPTTTPWPFAVDEMIVVSLPQRAIDHYEGVRTWLQGAFAVLEDFTIRPAKVA